ncbi:MAG: fumarate hydratase C-terminal domain-containing protein, partial [Clostridiales bacterium]|nr:fumarate hydratase C-terminal domain-containing protein [Clostridiales bacterium]
MSDRVERRDGESRTYHLRSEELRAMQPQLNAGDRVLLSGTIYTARDAAHKRIFALLDQGKELPFPLQDAIVYYAGPTP